MTTVSNIIDKDLRAYSMYTIENRAIPSVIDGFKPVARKILYAMIKEHHGKRTKVSDLGAISKYNYHHGETSAIEAAVKLTAAWSNNLPIFTGDGIFGSRFVQQASAARYIFAELSDNFYDIFQDFEVCDVNVDPENPEPQVYLPIIPWVLVNGTSGIAVGYACNFLPHDPKSIVEICKKIVKGQSVKELDFEVKFPNFKGDIRYEGSGKYVISGIVKKIKNNLYEISEVPVGYDRKTFIDTLIALKDSNKILSFTDKCDKTGFKFDIKVSNDYVKECDRNCLKFFKLEKSFTENYTTLDEFGKLKIFENKTDLVKYFIEYRLNKILEKIQYDVRILEEKIIYNSSMIDFIESVINKEIDLHNVTKNDLKIFVEHKFCDIIEKYKIDINKFINLPIYNFTKDQVEKLKTSNTELHSELKVAISKTQQSEFIKKLDKLGKLV